MPAAQGGFKSFNLGFLAPAGDQDWWGKHRITIGEKMPEGLDLGYSEALASSKFCFVLPGDGWSARLEDAVLHG